jgi:glycosyltransferase involved in cell wall biosynthesis
LRICLVNTFHYRRGGDATYTLDLARLLRSRGHEVSHFAMKHRYNADCDERDFFVEQVDYREASESAGAWARLGAFFRSLYSFEARSRFASLLDHRRPDIIHLQNVRRYITFSILGPARERGIPVVFTAHDYDPVCPNSLLFAGGEVCEVCRGKHYYRAPARRCKEGSFLGTAALAVEGYFVRAMRYYDRMERIITPSRFARDKLVECGFDPGRVLVIHNFVDTEALQPSYGGGEYAVFFGRLSAEKGIDVLMEAAAMTPDVKVFVAGEGPLRRELERRRHELHCDNLEFLGYVEKDDLFALIQQAMFVVVPSICYENFPYNILESFSAGKPVIGSDIGGIPEMIVEGKTGFLVAPGDPEALARRMLDLARNPSQRENMGRNARIMVETEFSADIHYRKLLALYGDVVSRREGALSE